MRGSMRGVPGDRHSYHNCVKGRASMAEKLEPIVVKFPLSGEWCAINTPAEKIPSHGTDMFGQTYAYDFFQIDWDDKGYKFFDKPKFQSFMLGVDLRDTFCWSQPIFSPFDGEVVEVNDGIKERNPVHIVRDLAIAIKNGLFLKADRNSDLKNVLGNYIILRNGDIFSLIAHARCHSILASAGDIVNEGQKLAEVGHSGNSTAPHLHFQLMDSPNLLKAKGLPCCFKGMKVRDKDSWKEIDKCIPKKRERVYA